MGKTDLMTEEKDTVSLHPQYPPGGGFGILLIKLIVILLEGGAVEACMESEISDGRDL